MAKPKRVHAAEPQLLEGPHHALCGSDNRKELIVSMVFWDVLRGAGSRMRCKRCDQLLG